MAPPPPALAPPPPLGQRLPPPSSTRHSSMLRCIALVVLAIIITAGLLALIIWLAIMPKKIKYSIEQGSISGYNLTNDHLNSNFHFVLKLNNPNRRISYYYDRIDVTVLYEDQKLSINNVHPFYQPRRNVTNLDLYLVAKNAVLYGDVARDMRMEKASGDVKLDVKIRAKIRLKIGVFKIHRTVKALCGSVTVPFDSSKSFERVPCDVDIDD